MLCARGRAQYDCAAAGERAATDVELRELVEEFLVINERRKAGIATAREEARWHELHARLTAKGAPLMHPQGPDGSDEQP